VTQIQQTVHCEILTGSGHSDTEPTDCTLTYSGQTVQGSIGYSDKEPTDCALTDCGHTIEDSSGHNDTEPTDSTLTDSGQTVEGSSGHSDTEPTDCTLTDNGQTLETAVDIVTQNQQTVQCEVLTDIGQTVEDSRGHIDTDPSTVHFEELTDFGRTYKTTFDTVTQTQRRVLESSHNSQSRNECRKSSRTLYMVSRFVIYVTELRQERLIAFVF